jgi:hypothetical protein
LLKINADFLDPQSSGLSAQEITTMKQQIEKMNEKDIQTMLESFISAEGAMKYATILQLPLELAVIDITQK